MSLLLKLLKCLDMQLIDTHTHPFDEAFDGDREQMIERARQAGVEKMLCPAVDSSTHEGLFAVCDAHPELCLPLMGLHPTSVNDNPRWREELELVGSCLGGGRKFCGVGEIGLDLHWSRQWIREQEEAFVAQAELAIASGLPIAVHVRDCWSEMRDVLRKFKGRGLRGVMHAFSGTVDDYRAVRECGDFLFGVGGVVTYKKSTVAEVLKQIPLEEIVLETDAPYLTPVPFRGSRNETSYIRYVCTHVASVKNTTEEEVARITSDNARRMFGL